MHFACFCRYSRKCNKYWKPGIQLLWFYSLTIPGNVKTIGSCAFEKCEKLTSVVLEEGVQEINNSAFENCKNIITVTIPSTMHVINECAFHGCTSVTAVYCNAAPGTLQWFTVSARPDFKIATDADPEKTKCYVKSEYLYAFTHSLGDRVNVVFTDGTIDIGSGAHLYGYTLSLAGDIVTSGYGSSTDAMTILKTTCCLQSTTVLRRSWSAKQKEHRAVPDTGSSAAALLPRR